MSEIDFTALKSELMWITPELAREWLGEKNEDNRRQRESYSADLVETRRRGEWKLTHQGIAFTRSGKLVDGQHRLRMVDLSGEPIQAFVTTGLADDVFDAIDCGLKRNLGDRARIGPNLASVCALALRTISVRDSPSYTRALIVAGLGACHADLENYAPTIIRYFSAAPMRLAACITILDQPEGRRATNVRDYVLNQYRALVIQDYDGMAPASKSLCRQVANGTAHSIRQSESLARGFRVFDPSRSQITKIQIMPDRLAADGTVVKGDVALAVSRVRDWVRDALKEVLV